jgi:endo-1,4-beta-xylanase
MVPIHAIVVAKDTCTHAEDVEVLLLSVTSNEPENGNGDGNTVGDIQDAVTGTADFDFLVRAERSGGGSGRVYTANYEATDAAGNSADAFGEAKVPHDLGKGTNGSERGRGVKKNPRN